MKPSASLGLKLPALPVRLPLAIMLLMLLAALAAQWLQPHLDAQSQAPSLEDTVPTRFGDWQAVPSTLVQANLSVATDGQPSTDQPYDQTLMRTYRNSQGQTVMLALAYGKSMRQEVKIHRPELCYPAQGFQVRQIGDTTFSGLTSGHGPVVGKQLLTQGGDRLEAVAYWIRIGDIYSDSAWTTRLHIIREGLAGRNTDGILVRASQLVNSSEEAASAYPALQSFLHELVAATPASTRVYLMR